MQLSFGKETSGAQLLVCRPDPAHGNVSSSPLASQGFRNLVAGERCQLELLLLSCQISGPLQNPMGWIMWLCALDHASMQLAQHSRSLHRQIQVSGGWPMHRIKLAHRVTLLITPGQARTVDHTQGLNPCHSSCLWGQKVGHHCFRPITWWLGHLLREWKILVLTKRGLDLHLTSQQSAVITRSWVKCCPKHCPILLLKLAHMVAKRGNTWGQDESNPEGYRLARGTLP